MLLSDILWFNSNTLIVECQHKNKKEDEKIHPLYIQNIHPAIILIIVHRKSKKLLMTVLTVAPTTNAKKQQTNELSSILSRYLIKTSFKLITPFTVIIP